LATVIEMTTETFMNTQSNSRSAEALAYQAWYSICSAPAFPSCRSADRVTVLPDELPPVCVSAMVTFWPRDTQQLSTTSH